MNGGSNHHSRSRGEAGGAQVLFRPLAAAIAFVFILALWVHLPLKLDHDVSYFLAAGRMLNQGAVLYRDLFDFNTTGPLFLGQFSAGIAAMFGTPLDITHKAVLLTLIFCLIALSLAVMAPLLRRPGPARWILALGFTGIALFATPELGRREHLAFLGLAPLALAIMLAGGGHRTPSALQIAAGSVAGLVLFLKPHFAFLALAIGLADLARAGGRPDRLLVATWIAAGVSITLYGVFLLSHPLFIQDMLPLAFETYGRYSPGWQAVAGDLLTMVQIAGIVLLALAGFLLARARSTALPFWPVVLTLLFMVAALAIHIQQGYGFAYHRLPFAMALSFAAVGLLAWAFGEGRRRPVFLGSGLAVLALILGLMAFSAVNRLAAYPVRGDVANHALVRALMPARPGEPILIICSSNVPGSQILPYLDVSWSGAMISHFPIPALIFQNGRYGVSNPPPKPMRDRLTHLMKRRMAERFMQAPPARVAVDISRKPRLFQAADFDILAWLREDEAFDRAWRSAGLVKVGAPIEYSGRVLQIYEREQNVVNGSGKTDGPGNL